VQRDAEVGLGPSQELPYHPNLCSPQPRKAKVCLQVGNKKFLLSEKYFSLGRGKQPGPLFAFQGKNPVFASFPLSMDKMWVLTNTPQSAVLSPLWCFVIIRLGRRSPQPAFLLQDVLRRCLWMPLCSWCLHGLAWAAHLPLPSWVGLGTMDVKAQLMQTL